MVPPVPSTVLACVGRTPLVRLEGVYCKLEYFNPSGSVKDRIAKYILEKAEATGALRKGMRVVEATSGNSGIAFAMACAAKGYPFTAILPEGMSHERVDELRAYGARIVTVPKKDALLEEAVALEARYAKKKNAYAVRQFDNPWNAEAHEKTLGRELVESLTRVDAFVAGVGTGGTLVGAGRALRQRFLRVHLAAVEPSEAAVLLGRRPRPHHIEGIGDGFVPGILQRHRALLDEVITVSSRAAMREARRLARVHGIQAGISSGANFLAAKRLQKRFRNVVTVFPDRGSRYFSMGLYR